LRSLSGRDRLHWQPFSLTDWKKSMHTPRMNGIVESCLSSNDLPRSIRFYQEQLGLRLLESNDHMCVFSVADKQALLIFRSGGRSEPVSTPGGIIPPHDAAGQLHFAFAISKEDFGAWEKHLMAQGIPIESKVNWPNSGQSLYFRDPDNHLVELATPGIWEVY
jgi:catechol 2,3-dioxygenase-like lactoylglutathione lyase family enzyme